MATNPANKPSRGQRFRGDPHPALQPSIVEYWGIARDLAALGGFTVTPDCYGELICCADDLQIIDGGRRERLPKCFVIALLDRPLRLEAPGIVRCMAARLRPWALCHFRDQERAASSQGWRNVESLFGPHLDLVMELVGRCHWPGLCGIFDRLFQEEVGRWQPNEANMDLVGQLVAEEQRSIQRVASEWSITRRQVERRVLRTTGMPPKKLASLHRFQKVRDALWDNPAIELAGLALEAGYADQAHMTRQFRQFAGQTPARFAREARAMKRRLVPVDVAFVQEASVRDG